MRGWGQNNGSGTKKLEPNFYNNLQSTNKEEVVMAWDAINLTQITMVTTSI